MANHYDFYSELGLSKSSDAATLNDQCNARLTELRNQNVNLGDARVQELMAAQQILGDPAKKAIYDATLEDDNAPSMGVAELRQLAATGQLPAQYSSSNNGAYGSSVANSSYGSSESTGPSGLSGLSGFSGATGGSSSTSASGTPGSSYSGESSGSTGPYGASVSSSALSSPSAPYSSSLSSSATDTPTGSHSAAESSTGLFSANSSYAAATPAKDSEEESKDSLKSTGSMGSMVSMGSDKSEDSASETSAEPTSNTAFQASTGSQTSDNSFQSGSGQQGTGFQSQFNGFTDAPTGSGPTSFASAPGQSQFAQAGQANQPNQVNQAQFGAPNQGFAAGYGAPYQQPAQQMMGARGPKKAPELLSSFISSPGIVKVIPILLLVNIVLLVIDQIISWFQYPSGDSLLDSIVLSIVSLLEDDTTPSSGAKLPAFAGLPETPLFLLTFVLLITIYLAPTLRKYSWLPLFVTQIVVILSAIGTAAIRVAYDESKFGYRMITGHDYSGIGDAVILWIIAAIGVAIIVMLFLKPVQEWTNSTVEVTEAVSFGQQSAQVASMQTAQMPQMAQMAQPQGGFAQFSAAPQAPQSFSPYGQQFQQSAQYPGAFPGNGGNSGNGGSAGSAGNGGYPAQPTNGYQQPPQSGSVTASPAEENSSTGNQTQQ